MTTWITPNNMDLSCKICFEIFTSHDLKRPRSIPCGHTLCGVCATKLLIDGKLKCPSCQRSFNFQNIKDIGINHALEDIIERPASVLAAAQSTAAISRQSTGAMSKPVEVAIPKCPKLHKGICDEHGCYKVHQCQTHDVFICSDCCFAYHMEAECRRVSIGKLLNDKTDDLRKKIENRLSLLQGLNIQAQEKCKKNENHDTMLKDRELQINNQIKKLQSEKNTVNQEMKMNQESTSKCKEVINECKDRQNQVQLLKTKVQCITNFLELNIEIQLNESSDQETQKWAKSVKDTLKLQGFGEMLISSLLANKVTYVTHTHNGCQRWGQIISRDGHILLQNLNTIKPQNDACVIKLSDVMCNLPSPRHVYLNYSTKDDKYLGKVVIRVNEEAPRGAKQLIDLCLGITGARYAGAREIGVFDKGEEKENLYLTYYLDANNRKTDENLYQHLEPVKQINYKQGLVTVDHNGWFFILTRKGYTGQWKGSSLGEVVSGLNVVEDIITNNLVAHGCAANSKIFISEAGLVIDSSWKKIDTDF